MVPPRETVLVEPAVMAPPSGSEILPNSDTVPRFKSSGAPAISTTSDKAFPKARLYPLVAVARLLVMVVLPRNSIFAPTAVSARTTFDAWKLPLKVEPCEFTTVKVPSGVVVPVLATEICPVASRVRFCVPLTVVRAMEPTEAWVAAALMEEAPVRLMEIVSIRIPPLVALILPPRFRLPVPESFIPVVATKLAPLEIVMVPLVEKVLKAIVPPAVMLTPGETVRLAGNVASAATRLIPPPVPAFTSLFTNALPSGPVPMMIVPATEPVVVTVPFRIRSPEPSAEDWLLAAR